MKFQNSTIWNFKILVWRVDWPNQVQRGEESGFQVGLAQTQDCKAHQGENDLRSFRSYDYEWW